MHNISVRMFNVYIIYYCIIYRICPPLFCMAKTKNGNKGKSRKEFKAETIKRLSLKL